MKNENHNPQKAVIWNTIGSGMNAATTMILTVLTSWIGGIEKSGIVGLGFGICFIFNTIASFEVRAYQSTDLKERFSFESYLGTRLETSLLSWLSCMIYIFIMRYSPEKAWTIFWICSFKIMEAVSDVFQGDFQQKGYLEYAGQSLFFRNIAGCGLYLILFYITRNVALSSMGLLTASVLVTIFFDVWRAKKFRKEIRPSFHTVNSMGIIRECWPLALSSFMSMVILNSAKIQVDRFYPELQGYWTALFMPASFVNLFGIFAFRPLLTTLTATWNEGKKKTFLLEIGKVLSMILIAAVLIVLVGGLLGIPMLELLYHVSLQGMKKTLILILAGGSFHAVSTFLWYMIIVVRSQKSLVLAGGVPFLFSLLIVPVMVQQGGLQGAAVSYLCSTALHVFALSMVLLFQIFRKRDRKG